MVLFAVGIGTAVWGFDPSAGLVAGGTTLAVFSGLFLIDLDEERDP